MGWINRIEEFHTFSASSHSVFATAVPLSKKTHLGDVPLILLSLSLILNWPFIVLRGLAEGDKATLFSHLKKAVVSL